VHKLSQLITLILN